MGIKDTNWSDILDSTTSDTSDKLPDSTYTARVVSAEGVIAQTGNPMIKLKVEVAVGPYAGTPVWTNIVIVPSNTKAMKWTLSKLKALGVDRDWLAANNPNEVQIAARIMEVCDLVDIVVTLGEEYQGERRNEIKNFKPASSAAPVAAAAPRPGVPQIPTPPTSAPSTPTVPTDATAEPF